MLHIEIKMCNQFTIHHKLTLELKEIKKFNQSTALMYIYIYMCLCVCVQRVEAKRASNLLVSVLQSHP